jgi:hypothetical protein
LIIYIYGDKKFKKKINTLLFQSDVKDNIQDINTLSILKSTIKESPSNIFLIDHNKIIDNSKLINKINFFKPKDGIEKDFLDQYGVGDICFNSMNGFVQYIVSRLNTTHVVSSNDTNNMEEFEFNNSIEPDDEIPIDEKETRDLANIICIDDIFDSEMAEAMDNFTLKNINKD